MMSGPAMGRLGDIFRPVGSVPQKNPYRDPAAGTAGIVRGQDRDPDRAGPVRRETEIFAQIVERDEFQPFDIPFDGEDARRCLGDKRFHALPCRFGFHQYRADRPSKSHPPEMKLSGLG